MTSEILLFVVFCLLIGLVVMKEVKKEQLRNPRYQHKIRRYEKPYLP